MPILDEDFFKRFFAAFDAREFKRMADAQERIADAAEAHTLVLQGIEKELQCICKALQAPPPLKAQSATLTLHRLTKKEN